MAGCSSCLFGRHLTDSAGSRLADRVSLLLLSGICRALRKRGPMQQCTGQGRLSCLPLWYSWVYLGSGAELPSGGGTSSSRCASVYFSNCPLTLLVYFLESPEALEFFAVSCALHLLYSMSLAVRVLACTSAHHSACIARIPYCRQHARLYCTELSIFTPTWMWTGGAV